MYHLKLKVGSIEKMYNVVALDPKPEYELKGETYLGGRRSGIGKPRWHFHAEFEGFSTKTDVANVEMVRLAKFLATGDITITDYDSPRWAEGGEYRVDFPMPLQVVLVDFSTDLDKKTAKNTLLCVFAEEFRQ